MEHPIGELMQTAMASIKDMVDVNTVIGEPVQASSGASRCCCVIRDRAAVMVSWF